MNKRIDDNVYPFFFMDKLLKCYKMIEKSNKKYYI
jgi:hypothetical protein